MIWRSPTKDMELEIISGFRKKSGKFLKGQSTCWCTYDHRLPAP